MIASQVPGFSPWYISSINIWWTTVFESNQWLAETFICECLERDLWVKGILHAFLCILLIAVPWLKKSYINYASIFTASESSSSVFPVVYWCFFMLCYNSTLPKPNRKLLVSFLIAIGLVQFFITLKLVYSNSLRTDLLA